MAAYDSRLKHPPYPATVPPPVPSRMRRDDKQRTLSMSRRVGAENLRRLNVTTEAPAVLDSERILELRDLALSGHAPWVKDGMELNIAATDEDYREESIAELISYIDMARQIPRLKRVNIHFPPKRWLDDTQTKGREGEYDLMIDGVRRTAEHAARHGIEIVLENVRVIWKGIPDDVAADQVDWTTRNAYFGVSPEEWIQVCEDVARPNVALCLDSSHICTHAMLFEPERRREVVMKYLAKPHLITHVHWNDNYLYDPRGRGGTHVIVGKGSLPLEFHRAVKKLDATLYLEHFYTTEELEDELEYIDSL